METVKTIEKKPKSVKVIRKRLEDQLVKLAEKVEKAKAELAKLPQESLKAQAGS